MTIALTDHCLLSDRRKNTIVAFGFYKSMKWVTGGGEARGGSLEVKEVGGWRWSELESARGMGSTEQSVRKFFCSTFCSVSEDFFAMARRCDRCHVAT